MITQTVRSIDEFITDNPAALLYFKNDKCGPCQVLRPKVSELIEKEFPEMKMLVVDSFASPALSGHYQVFANPTILVFFDGKETIRKSKYVSLSELKDEIGRVYGIMFDD